MEDKEGKGRGPWEKKNPENGGAVPRGGGVVVIAKQQDVIDGRADLSGGSIHEPEAHVAAGILDAVEVARDATVRGKKQHAAGVREEIVLSIERETEVCGSGGAFNGFFRAGEKVPAGIGFRAWETNEGFLFHLPCHLGGLGATECD